MRAGSPSSENGRKNFRRWKLCYRDLRYIIKEVIRADPEEFEGHLNLGICYAQKGFYAEAERAYQRARELNQEEVLIPYNLAALYALWNKPESSIAALKDALKLDAGKVLSWLRDDPMFESIRNSPEFLACLGAVEPVKG